MQTTGGRHTAYLLLGGNLGDRAAWLQRAVECLGRVGAVTKASAVQETEPWGFDHPVPEFLNQVVCLETSLDPEALLQECLRIERELGRERPQDGGYASRNIDIDILLYDTLRRNSPTLVLPHPRLKERPFALELLAQVLP